MGGVIHVHGDALKRCPRGVSHNTRDRTSDRQHGIHTGGVTPFNDQHNVRAGAIGLAVPQLIQAFTRGVVELHSVLTWRERPDAVGPIRRGLHSIPG